MGAAQKTTDHDQIRHWIEERGGKPATVEGTESKGESSGILRVDFPEATEDARLRELDWDEFFRKFEESALAFLFQDRTPDGKLSRFNKFVRRD